MIEIKIDDIDVTFNLRKKIIKKIQKSYNKDLYKTYDDIFGDKQRLSFDIKNEDVISTLLSNDEDFNKIRSELRYLGYTISDFQKGLCKKFISIYDAKNKFDKLPDNIKSRFAGYNEYAESLRKNEYNIGKILSRNNQISLLNMFANHHLRSNNNTPSIKLTVSRNSFDIATMSTNRGWYSCMELNDGEYKNKPYKDLKHGTLVCYVHSSSDAEIKKPVSRILIKRYKSKDKNSKDHLMIESTFYGTLREDVQDEVSNIIQEQIINKFNQEFVIASLPNSLYNDGIPEDVIELPEDCDLTKLSKKSIDTVLKSNNPKLSIKVLELKNLKIKKYKLRDSLTIFSRMYQHTDRDDKLNLKITKLIMNHLYKDLVSKSRFTINDMLSNLYYIDHYYDTKEVHDHVAKLLSKLSNKKLDRLRNLDIRSYKDIISYIFSKIDNSTS